tara:strand:+ start:402 stop:572 length:171 start_codon:yes stop_codon:yes gene_type:complete
VLPTNHANLSAFSVKHLAQMKASFFICVDGLGISSTPDDYDLKGIFYKYQYIESQL